MTGSLLPIADAVSNEVVSSIPRGLCVLVGVGTDDDEADAAWIARRIASAKLWPDAGGAPWRHSVSEIGGHVLCGEFCSALTRVSQFTLHARLKKGTKPDFHRAAGGEVARPLYESVLAILRESLGAGNVSDGRFGEQMLVALENEGPITISLDSKNKDA